MARPLRVAVPGAWYHVIAGGIERRVIFRGEAYYQKFEDLLAILPERFGVRLHAYVLMSNHYHLQIETPRLNLSEAIRWLNSGGGMSLREIGEVRTRDTRCLQRFLCCARRARDSRRHARSKSVKRTLLSV